MSSNIEIPDYYNTTEHLHWNPSVERKGLGTLLKRVNHVAIIVEDIGTSLTFYSDLIGFQVIKRPNFDRYGAWLTMGNVELHLIKGPPIVHKGDNLIVPHISLETDDVEEVLKRLLKLGIQFSRNVSVPDANEKKPVTQYFLTDPDGYYIEICNCGILTEFCLNLNPDLFFTYKELVNKIEISNFFDLAMLAEKVKHNIKSDLKDYILPQESWAEEADPKKLENLFQRTSVYGDCVQGETKESLSEALRASNNHVPTAIRIIRHKHRKNGQQLIPPSFYIEGIDKHDPKPLSLKINTEQTEKNFAKSTKITYKDLARKAFDRFDTNKDEALSRSEIYRVLLALNQTPNNETLRKIFEDKESINFEDFFSFLSKNKTADSVQLNAFFNMLDNDGNKKLTVSEFFMAVRALGIDMSDREIEEIFIESDINGDGYLVVNELESLLSSVKNDE
jgi:Ca2+-binding EF-hand superfamily protein/catechol 2,3-dioxygenase-like lactoylglutathione lyase family enzyme